MGVAMDSIVSGGCIVTGGRVVRSILSPDVRVNSYSEVEGSILFPNGRKSAVQPAFGVHHRRGRQIPENTSIGL